MYAYTKQTMWRSLRLPADTPHPPGVCDHTTGRRSERSHISAQTVVFSFSLRVEDETDLNRNSSVSLPSETSDRRMLLPGASGEQQLQHVPLQEVPQHVRGAEADWPVQVWNQDGSGSEGYSLSSNVCQVLIWVQKHSPS